MLSKEHRLKKTSSFQKAHKLGKHISGKIGRVIIYNRKDNSPSKFGVVISADRGNAARRNTAKRRIRHIFREICSNVKDGYDIFYVIWNVEFKYVEAKFEIEKMLKDEIHTNGDN